MEEVGVVLKAIDQFSGTINDMKKQLEGLAESQRNMAEKGKGGLDSLKSAAMELAPALSLLAVINWAKGAVMDAEKYNESLRHLKGIVESTGKSFEPMKDSIVKWADALRDSTRFTDDQAISSLENLTKKTGDVTTAQKLTQLAMDLTAKYGGELEDRVNKLGLAYIGNERGIIGLQKEFKGLLGGAKDGTEIFKALTDAAGGYAETEKNLTSDTEKAKNRMQELTKSIGEELIPAGNALMDVFMFIIKGLESMYSGLKVIFIGIITILHGYFETVRIVFTGAFDIATKVWTGIGNVISRVLKGDIKGAWDTIKNTASGIGNEVIKIGTDLKSNFKESMDVMTQEVDNASAQIVKTWSGEAEAKKGILNNIGGIVAKATKAETEATKQALEAQIKLYEKYQGEIGGIFADNLEKTWKGQQSFTDFFKSSFDDMTSYALKKLAEIAGNALFNAVMGLLGIANPAAGNAGGGTSKGLLGLGGFLGIFASGGYINNDGMAYLHKGEYVTPAGQVNTNHQVTTNNSVAPVININAGSGANAREIAEMVGRELQNQVRGLGQSPMI